jgi:hypothetical protein
MYLRRSSPNGQHHSRGPFQVEWQLEATDIGGLRYWWRQLERLVEMRTRTAYQDPLPSIPASCKRLSLLCFLPCQCLLLSSAQPCVTYSHHSWVNLHKKCQKGNNAYASRTPERLYLRLLDVSGQSDQILHFHCINAFVGLAWGGGLRPLAVSSMLTLDGLGGTS